VITDEVVRNLIGSIDNNRKYYSIERAREVLGYESQDNSAEWDGKKRVVGES
jgi:NAD+ dependent glucose-6-phosphate dehydrogenase